MEPTTQKSYGTISKALHWGIGITVIAMITIGFLMADMSDSPLKWKLFFYHKATGFTILWLAVIRLWWRLRNPVPTQPNSMPQWQVFLSDVTLWILYALMFIMPLSGITLSIMGGYTVDYFGMFTIPAIFKGATEMSQIGFMIYTYGAYALIGLVTLHVLAALYHHFIRKDHVLKRMLPNVFGK
jgi:cytochrome b561